MVKLILAGLASDPTFAQVINYSLLALTNRVINSPLSTNVGRDARLLFREKPSRFSNFSNI